MNELVSVNMTTFNRAHLLPRSIESILRQTYKNLEIVIVDDCSSDNTAEVVRKYQEKDDRIKYIRHETNKKNAAARNTALANSDGYYIAFMDDDDEWIDEKKLEKQIKIFEDNKDANIGIVCSSVRLHSDEKTYKDKIITKPDDLVTHILKQNGIVYSPTIMTKKEIMLEVGGFDTSLPKGVDSDFTRNCIVRYGYDVYFMPEVTTAIHEYGNDRMTRVADERSLRRSIQSNVRCLEKYEEYFKQNREARWSRKKRVLKDYIRLFLMDKHIDHLFEAVKIILK